MAASRRFSGTLIIKKSIHTLSLVSTLVPRLMTKIVLNFHFHTSLHSLINQHSPTYKFRLQFWSHRLPRKVRLFGACLGVTQMGQGKATLSDQFSANPSQHSVTVLLSITTFALYLPYTTTKIIGLPLTSRLHSQPTRSFYNTITPYPRMSLL